MTESTLDGRSKSRRVAKQNGRTPARSSRPREGSEAVSGSYALHDQPGFLLRVVLRRHTGYFTRMMVEGLTAPQFSTLAKLHEVGSCSQNYLGRLISFDSATITGVVERLRARDLIESREDPLDRRRRALQLTLEGRRVAELAIKRVTEISRTTFSPLTPAEKATLTRLLRKLADADGESNEID